MTRTDADGRALGIFRPSADTLDVGGMRQEVRVPVDVQARIHESSSIIWNPAAWGLAVGEDLFGPIEKTVVLPVYKLDPMPMTGEITIERRVAMGGGEWPWEAELISGAIEAFPRSGNPVGSLLW